MHLLKIPDNGRSELDVLFIAKHALSAGGLDREDGNHAVYHHEIRSILEKLGVNLTVANSPDIFFEDKKFDFVFSLLNRGGYMNSEILIPLLCERAGVPCLGASPILRGLGDDKHLMKVIAEKNGLPVAPWLAVRRGAGGIKKPDFDYERLVVKPNASSASWGIGIFDSWPEAEIHAAKLLDAGHDIIIEAYNGDYDLALPVIGGRDPWILPLCRFIMPDEEEQFRSYEEKRGLTSATKEKLIEVKDPDLVEYTKAFTQKILPEVWPFDYGRFEFRVDEKTREIRFMELNLSCNLWSKKTVAGAALMSGVNHAEVVEHILAQSMERQGLITAEVARKI